MSSSFQAVPVAVPSTSSASEEDPVIIITHEQPEAETPKDGKGHVDKKRRLSSFQAAWKMSFDWLSESKVGQGYAFCKVCHCNISIGHGGRHDLHRHMETEKHKINAKQASGRKVTDMFATQARQANIAQKVISAEVDFIFTLAEYNLPFSAADHLLKHMKKHYGDHEVLKKVSCGVTKSACITRDVLGPKYQEDAAAVCRKQPYCIYLDQSTDMGG
ncbi:uncharacterized protein LOC122800181 [Protopterus annectens]|uniref:uncharacterized protein LOC122800181 n=1 Tax=Protopterus annectens TaxID=7888 RepID=UPI001CF9B46A|nr:uncharacterized protein LOC122800181 [Protopterus annectens]